MNNEIGVSGTLCVILTKTQPIMKKLLFAIMIVFFNIGLKSQSYHPFPTENAVWHAIGINYFNDGKVSQQYILQGDTIIDNETWGKVYFKNTSFETRGTLNYLAAIRENENKQVLAKIHMLAEIILYDFSLEIGDTIWYDHALIGIVGSDNPLGFYDGPNHVHYKVVVDKDSVLLENGQYRNRITLNCFSEKNGNLHQYEDNQWIEGFGCTMWSGLFHPLVIDRYLNGDEIKFVCFKKNDEVLYLDNPYCDDCLCETFTSITAFDDTDKIFTVFPNPTKGTVKINASSYRVLSLTILDLAGRVIYRKDENFDFLEIDISDFESGIYNISVLTDKYLIARKIVKQ